MFASVICWSTIDCRMIGWCLREYSTACCRFTSDGSVSAIWALIDKYKRQTIGVMNFFLILLHFNPKCGSSRRYNPSSCRQGKLGGCGACKCRRKFQVTVKEN